MIKISSLVKKYGDKIAVNELCASFEERGVHALLGPVGAGKTTILDVIAGHVTADGGEVSINGVNISDMGAELKKRIAYLPVKLPLYEEMSVYEHLVFIGQAKRVPEDKLYKRVKSIMDIIRISEIADRTIKKLSASERCQLGIAQCMLGNPDVIMLDEPMAALDEEQREPIGALIKKLGEHKCVIITSSVLSDVEDICDDLIMLSRGELIVQDSIAALREKLIRTRAISVSVRGEESAVLPVIESITGISSCIITSNEGGVVSMKLEYDTSVEIRGMLFAALAKISCPILSMVEKSLTLSDVYLQLLDADSEESGATGAEDTPDKISEAGEASL